eukprot:7310667-Prymnesium_polylepis.1
MSSRTASRVREGAAPAPLPDDATRQRYFCRYPGCQKVYATTDGVRKHCRQQHRVWLQRLGPGCPDLYCRKDLEEEGEAPPEELDAASRRSSVDEGSEADVLTVCQTAAADDDDE